MDLTGCFLDHQVPIAAVYGDVELANGISRKTVHDYRFVIYGFMVRSSRPILFSRRTSAML